MRWRPAITSAPRPIRARKSPGRRALFRPTDADRDQSYFLFATTQEQIDYLRFPLGGMTKAETRALAEEMGLVVAKKADSQDICFVPQGKYADIINKLKPNAALAGDIVHLDGRVLGRHDGILHYHDRPAPRHRHRHRRAALCRASRCPLAPRHRRPEGSAGNPPRLSARRQLAGRRRYFRCGG
jgi:hypothetical protein